MPARVSSKIDGLQQLLRALDGLAKKVRDKGLKEAVKAADAEVLKAEQEKVPVDEGWLKLSLADRVKSYKRGAVVVGIVGPQTKFRKPKRGKNKGKKVLSAIGRKLAKANSTAWPTKYAHLVEFGTAPRVTKAGKFCGQVSARPFARPAIRRARAAAQAAMARKLREALGQ